MDLSQLLRDLIAYCIIFFFIGLFVFIAMRVIQLRRSDRRFRHWEIRKYKHLCPLCGYDLRSGHAQCPECGGPGMERRPPDQQGALDRKAMLSNWPSAPITVRSPDKGESPVCVHETNSLVDAILLAQQLESRGTTAWVERDDAPLDPTGQTDPRRVIVWSGDGAKAAEIATRFLKPSAVTVPAEQGEAESAWQLLLHDDNVNDVLHVVETIKELTLVSEQEAMQRMERAHTIGVALLLRVKSAERAEWYKQQFADRGLTVTIEPVSVVQAELV